MSVSPTLGFNIKTFVHKGYTSILEFISLKLSLCLQVYLEYMCVVISNARSACPWLFIHHLTAGDVGGQTSLRPYWRNYYEQTDAVVWVVDSVDRLRIQDCKKELHNLLLEDVRLIVPVLFDHP